MTKQDHVDHWKNTAEEDWLSAQDLFRSKRFLQCLFFAHLTIEKISKAHWIQDNSSDHPPRIHDILRLWHATTLVPTPAQEGIGSTLNTFQMDGRYPDYQRIAYHRATESFTHALLQDTDDLRLWLLSKLL